jgi:hypothetical protein
MAKNLLARYIWEVSTIYRAKRNTLKEINTIASFASSFFQGKRFLCAMP